MVRNERLELSRLSARASKTRMSAIPSIPHLKLVYREGVEPSRLSAHAPQACVSAIPPPIHLKLFIDLTSKVSVSQEVFKKRMRSWRDSNSQRACYSN
jgi:hypothetical protein